MALGVWRADVHVFKARGDFEKGAATAEGVETFAAGRAGVEQAIAQRVMIDQSLAAVADRQEILKGKAADEIIAGDVVLVLLGAEVVDLPVEEEPVDGLKLQAVQSDDCAVRAVEGADEKLIFLHLWLKESFGVSSNASRCF